ncbi:L-threonylcarbamoyladenylate synthase [Alkalihalobacillus sp. BA299]|uniref:L-threonylcarbamoyladenylate synthase n=1 Tax=Alkalihalobacillus sp. BA299 TaxID=2815938 RepID=UPI001ADC47C3|nr:L-threonylcarbamoyladenylate synthase [Alkalihalobacillus sp. BA299]
MSNKQTVYWIVDKKSDHLHKADEIKEAALWIKKGEVVAFPTETVYGLGGNALMESAIEKIFRAKGRPNDNPLIVHIASKDQLAELVSTIPLLAEKLMDAFWPGPLTIILPSKHTVSSRVTANLPTIAIRIPDHPVALALLKEAAVPVAAPSANVSGKPSPTTAEHVKHDLSGKIQGIVDGGKTGVGVESTVVDCTEVVPVILRPGGITKDQLEQVVGPVKVDPALFEEGSAPRSPGVKYTHYAPNAEMYLVVDHSQRIQGFVDQLRREGKRVGVMTTHEHVDQYEADLILPCGYREDLETVASDLYETLRKFDEHDIDMILAETFPKQGVGVAIMNRLEKAAGKRFL